MTLTPAASPSPGGAVIRPGTREGRTPGIIERAFRGATVRVFAYDLPPQHLPAVSPGDTGDSAPVFLAVHGFRGDHHGFEQIVFASGGLWWVPDFPGYGASTRMPEGHQHDAETFSDLLMELVVAARAEHPGRPVVVVGHSFGTVVVSRAAGRLCAQGGADAVILINPISVPALEGASAVATGAATLYYRVSQALPRAFGLGLLRSKLITQAMTVMMRTSPDSAVRSYIDEQHRAYFAGFQDSSVLMETYLSSIRDSVRERASEFAGPALLIAGGEDAFGSPATQKALADLMPSARLVMIDGVGHLIHYEAADAAATAIRSFLGGVLA
jgi:pimeloyl-ACP methyl ester carboxylesterase